MGNHFIRELSASRPSVINLICFAHACGDTSRYRTLHAELQEYAKFIIPVNAASMAPLSSQSETPSGMRSGPLG